MAGDVSSRSIRASVAARWLSLLACGVASPFASPAAAQPEVPREPPLEERSDAEDDDGEDDDGVPASGLTPPRLERFVDGPLPPDTLTPGQRVEVGLTLLIAADGSVTDATIAEGAGEPFDAAAVAAARQFVFRPATRDGTPIAARIGFRYVFEEPALEEPPPPLTGALRGRVLTASGDPVSSVSVELTYDDGTSQRSLTDEGGGFAFAELAPGAASVRIRAEGFTPLEQIEEVVAGEELSVTYRLRAAADGSEDGDEEEPELGVTAIVDRPQREATRYTLPREVLARMPGTRGDALRVIELLPGVARPPFGSGQIVIRGAAPGDSEVFLGGVSVPLLYHFGGLTSFWNSRLLERIDYYPGNFSVRYGRRIGGIIEVEPRDPTQDRNFHGVLDINLIDSSLLLEIPLWDNASIALAARRSYIDFFFSEVVPEGVFNVIAAPVYYDYQLVFTWRPTPEDRIRVLGYGSSDEFRTVFGEDSGTRPFNLELATQFHRAQAEWRHVFDDRFQQETTFAAGWTGLVIQAGQAFGFNAEFVPLTLRSEWRYDAHPQVKLRWGTDWTFTPVSLAFRAAGTPQQSEGQPPDSGSDQNRSEAAFTGSGYRPAVYFESSLQPVEAFTLVLGLRVDYFRDISAVTFDPRATFRWQLDSQWTIKGGIGLFSQPPEFQESAPGLGNPNLDAITALHTSVGVELRWDETFRFGLEGYYKHIFDRVVGTQNGLPPFFLNDGIGRIYGAELSARMGPTPGFPLIGILSYTLSRSERLDPGADWRAFDFDQTHILTTSVVWRIGDGWEAGASFRLISGNPYTPVVSQIYNVGTGAYQPIYGAVNSERNPFFTRLDLRIEKVFTIDIVRLAIYLDIQNVYNAQNREAITYSYDYRDQADVIGLPILPSLGIRGEL
ncbi:MAG: TonB-dependent receptor [Sandaracinaceae bacterium]